jgi:FKBP-type peptidyl-prolyl cis-trans isomerase FklB
MSFRFLSLYGLALVMLASSSVATAQDEANKAAAAKDPMGYFLGMSVGQTMAQQGFAAGDFDSASLAAGVVDGLAGLEPALSDDQLQEVRGKIEGLLRKRQEAAIAKMKQEAAMNKEKGALWLAENGKKEGIKSLEGGLQYKVVKAGNGESPSASDMVKVHYTGTLTSGKVFDSSVKRGEPAEFRVGQVIKGWQMALQQMKVGDKWMLYIPPELAYGEEGRPGAIGPNEVLVFEVELLEII